MKKISWLALALLLCLSGCGQAALPKTADGQLYDAQLYYLLAGYDSTAKAEDAREVLENFWSTATMWPEGGKNHGTSVSRGPAF